MNASLKAKTALGFLVAMPLFALPALGASAPEVRHNPAHHLVAEFAKARALASPLAPAGSVRETDGLSRNVEECNMGCIDNH
ncbi:MAG: hypothetical protein JO288_17275 [Hyphomicrobiales bacterium]|nr:hypothetical protein [Hyphomicrobiales bacterium]